MSNLAIWSLHDVLKFHAALFLTAFVDLEMTLATFIAERDGRFFKEKAFKAIQELKIECNRAGLQSSVDQITRIERWFIDPNTETIHYVTLLSDLRGNIQQELLKRTVFALRPDEIQYYNDSFIQQTVKDKFPSTVNDLSESGKCLIFDRPTASVFHAMRALEVCLECLVQALNIAVTNPNWENVINDCQTAIRNLHLQTPRSQTWREDQQFYAECATEFRYFKDAWRNHVMHRRADYGPGEGMDILLSVQRFIVHLSGKLQEQTP